MLYAAVMVLAYLLGSVPFGFLAGKLNGVDLRQHGSGNIGATNALRVLGKGWGYTVFALDFAKGALGVAIGKVLIPDSDFSALSAAIFCVLGHNFPVWLGFKGGKGIATSGGIMIMLYPPVVFALALFAWMGLFFTLRYVSVASIAAALSLTIGAGFCYALGWISPLLLGAAIVMTAVAVYRHKSNIKRLMDGTEPRFTRRKTPSQGEQAS